MIEVIFYVSGAVAVAATLLTITRVDAVHALLYLVVSLLAMAVVFFTLGAPYVAALEMLVYAGAIMVLFIFVVMTLNMGPRSTELEGPWLKPGHWAGPAILSAVLLAEVSSLLVRGKIPTPAIASVVGPKQIALELFGPYLLGVELASILLLAALVGAYHLGRRLPEKKGEVRYVASAIAARAGASGHSVRSGNGRAAGAPESDLHSHVR
jgi:NADH-quinone oxidoreductase subunit J